MIETNFEDKTYSAYHIAGAENEAIKINIPSGQTFVLTHFGNDVDDASAWGYAEWNVLADGCPVRSYTAVKDQYGAFNQLREIPFGFVKATRDLIIYTKNGHATDTFKIGVSIKGVYLINA